MKYDYFVKLFKWSNDRKHSVREVHEHHMCAINTVTGGDACGGDSGGPLVYRASKTGRHFAVGVTSGGFDDCGNPETPGLYTKVKDFRDFIKKHAQQACWKKFTE